MTKKCNHEYEVGMVLAGKLNCKHCGLLKSTIEAEQKCPECQFENGEHSQECFKYVDEFAKIDEIIKEKQEKWHERFGGKIDQIFNDLIPIIAGEVNIELTKKSIENLISEELLKQKVELKQGLKDEGNLSFIRTTDLAELLKVKIECMDDYEKKLDEYRNSPDIWKNVGISKWRNWGEQNKYFDFFEKKIKQEAVAEYLKSEEGKVYKDYQTLKQEAKREVKGKIELLKPDAFIDDDSLFRQGYEQAKQDLLTL